MSASSTPAFPLRQATLLVAFMWGAYFLNYCDRQAVFAMFPALRTDLGMSDRQLGLTGAMFLWVYAFGCPVAGLLADRFSKRILVVLSLSLWSLVTVATGLSVSAFMLLGLRAAMGISESLFMPTAIALTAGAYPPALRSRAVSLLTTAQIAGTVGGSWFGGWMADRGQWRGAFFALGGVGLLYAVPYFWFLRSIPDSGSAEPAKDQAPVSPFALLRVSTFLLLCAVFPVFVFGLWLLYGWLPAFLHDKFALSQAEAAYNATVFVQATTAVGLLGGGRLADALYKQTRAARLWLMCASLLLCAPCLHALGNSVSLLETRVAAAGFGLFSGLLMGNIFPGAFDVVSSHSRATAVGVLNFCGAIMSGCATLFGGELKQSLGIGRLLSFTAVAYAVAALVLMVGIKMVFPADFSRNQPPVPAT
jgi:predicted MFS family arabinose efflux permease